MMMLPLLLHEEGEAEEEEDNTVADRSHALAPVLEIIQYTNEQMYVYKKCAVPYFLCKIKQSS